MLLNGQELEGTYDNIDDVADVVVGFNVVTSPGLFGVLSITSKGYLMINTLGGIGFINPTQ